MVVIKLTASEEPHSSQLSCRTKLASRVFVKSASCSPVIAVSPPASSGGISDRAVTTPPPGWDCLVEVSDAW